MSGFPTSRGVRKLAGKDRVVVDGVDVTWFRASYPWQGPNKVPPYSLMEPFGYGASTLPIKRVHAAFEQLGVGALSWVRAGAEVRYERVMPDTSIVTDYVGVVEGINVSGRSLTLQVGGQFTGRASARNVQPPPFRYMNDVGHWAELAARTCGLNFAPFGGPVTGIKVQQTGGQTLLSWAQYVGTMSQDNAGVQRALMPSTWGGSTWGFNAKDYTTKHLTIYTDDARAVASLTDDSLEQPTTFYATGTTPEGVRISNAKWPGVFESPPPDYPISGGAPFGIGTTNADTVNGDGISVLYGKLVQESYLDSDVPEPAAYDIAMADAVMELKRQARLTVNGTMTLAAWKALFDIDITGFSLNGAKVHPIVSDTRVEEWLYTANGSYAGRNPAFDPHVLRVERNIDFGPGVTKRTMINYCRGQLTRAQSVKNWVGTIRLNQNGAFTGEHSGADATSLTSADLMRLRDIRPGMNAWLPLFDGGTLVHIAGIDVDPDGATLTVDTQARDLLELSEIIARNRESRRDPRREWNAANRTSKHSHAMVTRDENFGRLDRNVALTGGQWNKVQVIVGQQGTVNLVDLRTVNNKAEFAVAFMSVNWTVKRMQRRVGNPLTTSGQSWLERDSLADLFDNREILYASGTGNQPAGYGPNRRKRDDNGDLTGATISGRLWDEQTWTYHCDAGTRVVITMMIWPDRDCTLKRGQILWPLLDDAA